jgi:glycosyltransferase involved in cell wall biosynthesis
LKQLSAFAQTNRGCDRPGTGCLAAVQSTPMEAAAGITASLVLPTRNEVGSLGAVLDALLPYLKRRPDVEVLVVDASTDGTAELVQEYARAHPLLRSIRQEGLGLRNALLQGAREARGRFVLFLDADGQHPAEAAFRLLETAESSGTPVVVGSRYAPGGSVGKWRLSRQGLSRAAALLARWCVPGAGNCTDPLSGLFLVDRTLVDDLPPNRPGWKLLLEILALDPARPIVEVPYSFQSRVRGLSKLNAWSMHENLCLLVQLSPGIRYMLSALGFCAAFWLGFLVLGMATGGWMGRGYHSLIAPDRSADSRIYLELSRRGLYQGEPNVPFLPLYPLLIAATATVLHSSTGAALALSFLGTVCGLWVVQALADAVLGQNASQRALWYTLISPVSFFLLNGYSEGLFFGLSALTLWYGHRRRWVDAGLMGALAAMTRAAGIFLFPALMAGLLAHAWKRRDLPQWWGLAALSLIPLAFLGIAVSVGGEARGLFSLWQVEHDIYGRLWAPPWVGVGLTLKAIWYAALPERLLNCSKLFYGLGWPLLLVVTWRSLTPPLSIYTLCTLVLVGNIAPQQPTPWWSLDRFLLPVFPAYLAMTKVCHKPVMHKGLSVLCLLLLTAQWVLYTNGYLG